MAQSEFGRSSRLTWAAVDAGRELLEAREKLPRGQFLDWIKAECGFGEKTAYNYISAAIFVEDWRLNVTVTNLRPALVYRLAAKNVPPPLVQDVVQRLKNGEAISTCAVSEALEVSKQERLETQKKQIAQKRREVSARTRRKWEKQRALQEQEESRQRARQQEAVARVVARIGVDDVRFLIGELRAGDTWEMVRLLAEAVDPLAREAA
ncbi:DUF3102 domain-containing protein [Bradyrhizobium sp. USDA 3315]